VRVAAASEGGRDLRAGDQDGAVRQPRGQRTPAPEAGDEPGLAVPEVGDPGTAGASARREFERRKTAYEERIRAKHPKLGGLILAISENPQSTTAWNTGALGEEKLGGGLNSLACDTIRLLQDRRLPISKANIDHLAVTPTGV
jgi:hypothetical protein